MPRSARCGPETLEVCPSGSDSIAEERPDVKQDADFRASFFWALQAAIRFFALISAVVPGIAYIAVFGNSNIFLQKIKFLCRFSDIDPVSILQFLFSFLLVFIVLHDPARDGYCVGTDDESGLSLTEDHSSRAVALRRRMATEKGG